MVLTEKDEQRFWSKVALPNDDGCMVWRDAKTRKGYGRFKLSGKHYRAHRVSYELLIGPIPDGLVIDHVRAHGCKSRACVNVQHLEPVTSAENNRRSAGVSRYRESGRHRNSLKTHCVNNHPFDEANTYFKPDGRRQCRTCAVLNLRRFRARQSTAPSRPFTRGKGGPEVKGRTAR